MDTLQKIDKLQARGIRVTIDWINQIENGHAEHVNARRMPLWTCTATAWDDEGVLDAMSADTITDALTGLIMLLGEETEE